MEIEEQVITASGISPDEQRAILTEIDGIAAENRLRPGTEDLTVHAKKQGTMFPVLVNISALFLLGGGLFLLFVLHQQDVLRLQEGASYIGLTERQLIQTIRRESSSQLSVKDREIADILAKLTELNLQLQNMQQSMDRRIQEKEAELRRQIQQEIEEERRRLTEEQLSDTVIADRIQLFEEQKQLWLKAELAAFSKRLEDERLVLESQIQKIREEYLHSLALLQGERVQLLEAARIREENLQAQLSEKKQDYSGQDFGSVRDELYRLTGEWERSALIEGELNGFYIRVNQQIRDGQISQAANTLVTMREFLDTPAFQHLQSLQSRKEFYLASIDVLSEIITGGLSESTPEVPQIIAPVPSSDTEHREYAAAIAELKAQNQALEQAVTDRDQTIAAFEQQPKNQGQMPANQGQMPANYEETVKTLRAQNTSLQQTVTSRDSTINTLRTQNADLQQTVTSRDSTVNTLRTQNANLQQTVTSRDSTINTLRTQNANLQQTVTSRDSTVNTLRTQNTSLQQTVTNRDNTINTLRAQNTNLQQTVTSRDSTVNTLRAQNTNLQQIVGAHENTIKEFRSQNEGLQQTVTARDSTINTLRAQNTNLQQGVTNRDSVITDLRTQTANLQQTVTARDSTINTLRAQNTSLQQTMDTTITELRTQTTSLQQTVAARDSTISDLRTQTTNLQQTAAARDSAISDLRTQTSNLQQTVAARDSTISDLRTQTANLNQTVDQLRQTNEAVRKLLGTQ